MKRQKRVIRGTAAGWLAVVVMALATVLAPAAATACPNCKEAVAEQDEQGLADGFNYTVLGMVSLPFLVVGTVAAVTIRAYTRRSNQYIEKIS